MQHLDGKRVLVVGLARSGRAAADLLRRRGAMVTVSDSRPPWSFAQEIPELLAAKIGLEFGQNGIETALAQDLIVVSPGVPWDLPSLAAARGRGIPVVAEVEAGSWFLRGDLVGVTGSNGKTTTTSLIGRMLAASGIHTLVAGNIGVPLTSTVDQATDESAVVVELSSFQLEGTDSLHPRVSVILNITPNHLDRHPSFEAYVEAKARILRNQSPDDYAVLNADDPAVLALADGVRAQKVFFSRTQDLPEGLLVSEGKVVYRVAHLERELFSPLDVRLRGLFNLENVLAASAAACALGADFDVLGKAVREFRGVEHRLEPVGEVLGVEFYNDSKATSVDATAKALGAFDRGVHLILGGKDKGAPYAPLVPLLKGRVREILLIGEAAGRIAAELAGTVELVHAGDLEAAARLAFQHARAGDVILLSPACSSYDQFQDFEQRGRAFKAIVEALAREGEEIRANRSRAALQGLPPKPQPKSASPPETVSGFQPQAQPAPPLALPTETAPDAAKADEARPQPGPPPPTAPTPTPSLHGLAKEDVQEPELEPAGQAVLQTLAAGMPEGQAEPDRKIARATAAPLQVGTGLAPSTPTTEAVPDRSAQLIAEPGPAVTRSECGGEKSGPSAAAPEAVRLPESSPAERIYVYEMDAEDRPPLDLPEIPLGDVELVRDDEPAGSRLLDSATLRKGRDESLIFEVTSTPEAASAGTGESVPAAKPGGRGRRKRTSRVEDSPGPGDSQNQDRFRGL